MSDLQYNRRADDMRIEKIENSVDQLKEDVGAIKIKIFNGFSHNIENTAEKVSYIDKRNLEDHKNIMSRIDGLGNKFDKLLWALVSVSFLLIVSEVARSFF